MPGEERPVLLTRKTGVSVGVILALMSPLLIATAFLLTLHDRNKANHEAIQVLTRQVELLKDKVEAHSDLPWHAEMHAEVLRRTADRWARSDDRAFMTRFAYENNLKMPAHRRVDDD